MAPESRIDLAISYASEDRVVAMEVAASLRELGWTMWVTRGDRPTERGLWALVFKHPGDLFGQSRAHDLSPAHETR